MGSQDYILVDTLTADGGIPIKHYLNTKTGLNIYIAYVESPIVKGNLVLPTEAFDDDGLPHTLEHLVFMGSEEYPYNGVLDKIANICLASGTNACTDTDYTSYDMSTAGSAGFLKLLPVFLDHVLFPTLTDSAYHTEVHHINGKGEDAGVVYCEMQACENTANSIVDRELINMLYPGVCGYRSNTGGSLKNLRHSTSNTKVREYHKEFYHSRNLSIIITGTVSIEEMCLAIKPFDDKIVARGVISEEKFTRPWQTPVEPLEKCCTKQIKFPCDSETDGLVSVGFRGPNIVSNYLDFIAISLLLEYLNSTSTSPIQQEFVECDDPICSSVDHSMIENSTSCFSFSFEGVNLDQLHQVGEKLLQVIADLRIKPEAFLLDRMKTIISRKIVRIHSVAETSPHSLVKGAVIGHVLYGSKDNLNIRCNEIPLLNQLLECDKEFWFQLIDKYFTGPTSRYVIIDAAPSVALMEELANTEKKRLEKQKEDLKDDLHKLADKLKLANEEKEKPVPDTIMENFKLLSLDKITFHQIERNALPEEALPFKLIYDSIKTNFVTISVLLDTSNILDRKERLYLPLLTELLFELPVMRGDTLVTYETIVEELFADTVTYGAGIGICNNSSYSVGVMSMLLGITMQVETQKYDRAVSWLTEILFNAVFTTKRIRSLATRLLGDISQLKRSGSKVTSACFNGLIYQSNSNQWATNFLRQKRFLTDLLKNLKEAKQVLEKLRDVLLDRGNMFVHLTTNKEKMSINELQAPWRKLIPEKVLSHQQPKYLDFAQIIPCYKLYAPVDNMKQAVVGVGSIESNYLLLSVRSDVGPMDPDLPALYVLIQYLTQLEGPLWTQVRGLGLSYNYSLSLSTSEGLLKFLLYKSSQLVSAYKLSRKIVNRYLDGEESYEDVLFQAAKSSLIYELISSEKNASEKSIIALISTLRGLPEEYNRNLIASVASVKVEDLIRVGPLYLRQLFDDKERRIIACCNPSKVAELVEGLKNEDCILETINLDTEPLLNNIE